MDQFCSLVRKYQFKIDNARKSGTGKLTEIDDLVIDIIGKKSSALICDFGGAESLEPHSGSTDLISTSNNSNTTIQNKSAASAKYVKKRSNNRKRKQASIDEPFEIAPEASANNEKLQLEIEYFKLRNHRTKLEILKLEQELNLPKSEFTASLWAP